MRWHLSHKKHGDKPWAVQAEAMRRSDGIDRYGYFLEMGLGKTALTLNDYIEYENDVDLMIDVAPQSFKADWTYAPEEWGVGFLNTGMWPKTPLPFDWEQGLYSINYEAISRSSAKNDLLKLLEKRRVMLVFDESKALGSPNSGWTKASIELAKRAAMVRLLNGTPVTQSPMDLYGQLRALGKLNGWLPTQFRNRYAVLGGYMGKQVLKEFRNEEELATLLDSCSFRALKSEWRKDLPPKVYRPVHLELTDNQRRHYQTMLDEFYVMTLDGTVTAEAVVTQMIKLQQITSGFILENGKAVWLEKPEKIAKLQAVKQMIDGPGKSIVVHHFTETGKMLLDQFRKEGYEPAYIQGRMDAELIVQEKKRFNEDSKCRVLVGQEVATARGHTLIGSEGDRCTKTAFYENGFSYYYRSQMEDRNHRGDQDETCTCWDFVASPVEERAVEILQEKKEMADSLDTLVDAVRKTKERRNGW